MNRARSRTSYVCQECGGQSPKWEGRCSHCGQWNTLAQVQLPPRSKRERWLPEDGAGVQDLSTVATSEVPRITTPFKELDRVLGGGIVPGSIVLIAGDPGIGKSTLLLQTAAFLALHGSRLLYVSGEESAQQVRLRAERLGVSAEGVLFLGETELEQIVAQMDAVQPALVVIDSVQTLSSLEVPSGPGSVTQVRECTRILMKWAKSHNAPVLLAGHVTKDGSVAGPRALEHMVDVVLYMEGDALGEYRILRCAKNRFGSTNEIGIFQMGQRGLVEVAEPSNLFLSSRRGDVPGSTVTISMEGSRPLLAEVQALTTPTVFAQPRRTATGIDFQRLMLMTAVASKRLGIPLGDQDIIVNVVGGLRLQEPAADLATALALVSSFRNTPCDPDIVAVAEVGLGGELRGVPQLGRRLGEAARLGFRRAVVAASQLDDAGGTDMEIIGVHSLAEAVRKLLPRARSAPGGQRKPRDRDMLGAPADVDPDTAPDSEAATEHVSSEVPMVLANTTVLSDQRESTS